MVYFYEVSDRPRLKLLMYNYGAIIAYQKKLDKGHVLNHLAVVSV